MRIVPGNRITMAIQLASVVDLATLHDFSKEGVEIYQVLSSPETTTPTDFLELEGQEKFKQFRLPKHTNTERTQTSPYDPSTLSLLNLHTTLQSYWPIYLTHLIWKNEKPMMASSENLSLYSSLLGEDLSLWSIDDHAKRIGDGASLDPAIQFVDSVVSPGSEATETVEGDLSDPLPEWMSEKIDVNDWLNDFDRPFTHELPMNKIQSDDPYDIAIADYVKRLDEEEMLPLSPVSSIGSGGTAVSSAYSPAPSSPFSLAETNSTGFDSGLDSLPQGMPEESVMMADVESLLNSCKDTDTFLSLAGSVTLQLPISSMDEMEPLLVDVSSMQTDLQGKVKAEPLPRGNPLGGFLKTVAGKEGTKPKVVTKERRERKKGQNKEAATRYRIKKKKESESLTSALSGLENKNGALKEKVDSLEKEISYLKELLQEIYKVKGQINILKSP